MTSQAIQFATSASSGKLLDFFVMINLKLLHIPQHMRSFKGLQRTRSRKTAIFWCVYLCY
jgi:hypothetical protein